MLVFKRAELELEARQLGLNGRRLVTEGKQLQIQLQHLGEQQDFERRGIELNIQDLGLRLRALRLQRDLMDGKITQAQFDREMAEIARENIDLQIRQTELALEKAEADEEALNKKQRLERETLKQQIEANNLAKEANELAKQQLPEKEKALDREEKQIGLELKRLAILEQQQVLAEKEAKRGEHGAEQDLLKEQANDLSKVMDQIRDALSGKDIKFDALTTVETQTRALLAVLDQLPGDVKEKLDALRQVLGNVEGAPDLLEAIGLGPEFQRALEQGVEAFAQAMQKIKDSRQRTRTSRR